MKGIADTGFLVAFVSLNDRHHEWAVSIAEEFTDPLLTCEAVLSEQTGPRRPVPDQVERVASQT
jgi:hypothetical protein